LLGLVAATNVSAAGFSLAAPMMPIPVWATATLLPNGMVLVAGGNGANSTSQRYDPTTNTWSSAGTLARGRMRATATLLTDGRVLVAGGQEEAGSDYALNSAELRPREQHVECRGNLTNARYFATQHSGEQLRYWLRGQVRRKCLQQCGTVRPGVDTGPAGTFGVARQGAVASLLPNGKVLASGRDTIGGNSVVNDVYDPTTNAWTPAAR
jgi:hypothetical protein